MYPRNAASPPQIAIGAVVQISDGAVQADATVRIITTNDAEADAAGTVAYSTQGVTLYTPTQGETNHASFIVIAKKTGCIPVAQTIITSASATAGYAGVDWAVVANPTSTVGLTGTTIAVTQKVDVETIKTQAITCAAGVTVLASVGTAATSTAQTGDTYALANGATGFVALDTAIGAVPTAIENADAFLDRNMATGADSGSTTVRTPRQALRALRNKWTNIAGTYSVKKEDDSTESWSSALTTDAAAVPITQSDPGGP